MVIWVGLYITRTEPLLSSEGLLFLFQVAYAIFFFFNFQQIDCGFASD